GGARDGEHLDLVAADARGDGREIGRGCGDAELRGGRQGRREGGRREQVGPQSAIHGWSPRTGGPCAAPWNRSREVSGGSGRRGRRSRPRVVRVARAASRGGTPWSLP